MSTDKFMKEIGGLHESLGHKNWKVPAKTLTEGEEAPKPHSLVEEFDAFTGRTGWTLKERS